MLETDYTLLIHKSVEGQIAALKLEALQADGQRVLTAEGKRWRRNVGALNRVAPRIVQIYTLSLSLRTRHNPRGPRGSRKVAGPARPPREPDEGDLVRQAKLVVRSSCRAYEPEILGAQPGLLGDELA